MVWAFFGGAAGGVIASAAIGGVAAFVCFCCYFWSLCVLCVFVSRFYSVCAVRSFGIEVVSQLLAACVLFCTVRAGVGFGYMVFVYRARDFRCCRGSVGAEKECTRQTQFWCPKIMLVVSALPERLCVYSGVL